ncbi:sigma-54-dependent Fis family transcriptional regulator [bacterium]|nr:sigma-54-dependent Fis family transcriptional regulator [bacterium]
MSAEEKILVVDDDAEQCDTLSEVLAPFGKTVVAYDGSSAIEIAKKEVPALVVSDLVLPGKIDGLALLRWFNQNIPDASIILITGYATVETALSAMKSGAYDYLTKPVDIRRLRALAQKALERYRISADRRRLLGAIKGETSLGKMVGTSNAMRDVFEKIESVARMDSTVLITGESGTGKELVAEAIHELSGRKGNLVKLNCSAIPENLLESELFGYEKGAFTGAVRRKPGKFELANGGTLFLDEIGDMPLSLQAKVLRTIETGEVEPLGATATKKVDVRIVAATNKNLEKLMADGKFREDLYYRLMVFPIRIPPLREHPEDIPILVSHFLKQLSEKLGRNILGVSEEVMDFLIKYRWPGNVRQLRNALEEMAILSKGEILDKLPTSIANIEEKTVFQSAVDEVKPIEELEREAIMSALERTGGNKTKAAKLLGIGVRTLYRKLEKFSKES